MTNLVDFEAHRHHILSSCFPLTGSWNDSTDVAVKTLKPGKMSREDFLKEAKIMKNLNHPNLVKLYAVCTADEPIYIVTELLSQGSLLSYLREGEGQHLELTVLVDMMAQVSQETKVLLKIIPVFMNLLKRLCAVCTCTITCV